MSTEEHVADRSDPHSLVIAAQRLYASGSSPSEVLKSIYGVDMPREAYLFRTRYIVERRPLSFNWLVNPWELMKLPEEGGPSRAHDPISYRIESRAFAQAPNLLPLVTTGFEEAEHGESLLCYDLDELRAGRTTIVGLEHELDMPESGADFTVFGPSLLDVFRGCIVEYHALMEKWIEEGRYKYTHTQLAEVEAELAGIDELRQVRT
jgi:hypothetical protein